MVFIEAETDPFTLNQQEQLAQTRDTPLNAAIRRPLRGIEVRDPTYSYMRVIDDNGVLLPWHDSGAADPDALSITYANYLIQSLTFSNTEKFQIIPTFGDTYVLFFGQHPVQAQLTGGLLHTMDFPWSEEMWQNYNDLIRGTKLAERGARLYLYYDGVLLEGYPTAYQPNQTSDVPNLVPFSMSLLVSSVEMLCPTTTDYPSRRQPVDLQDPAVYEQLLAMSDADRQAFMDQFAGSQLNQINRARYLKERKGPAQFAELGVLIEAQKAGTAPPLQATRIESLDYFMQHGGVSGTELAASPSGWMHDRIKPLRGRIYDNVDEYVVRPSEETAASEHDPDSLPDDQLLEETGLRPWPLGSSRERRTSTDPVVTPPSGLRPWPIDEDTEPTPPVSSTSDPRYTPDAGTIFGTTPGGPPSHGSAVADGRQETMAQHLLMPV